LRRTLSLVVLVAALGSLIVAPVTASGTNHARGTLVSGAFNAKLRRTILVNAQGLTVYGFTADTGGKPTCYNDPADHCSKAWPPLTTLGAPRAGKGARASLLGTVKRKDGTLQVTYKRIPLYTDAGAKSYGLVADKKPGDVNGIGFAQLWFALTPNGKPVTG
jgi:predicted lipoprotein with Yx(FWY)xxD motif